MRLSKNMPGNSSNKLIGVVLCGGKSSRMGSDKGLLSVNSERWFEKNFKLVLKIFSRVVVSINALQYSNYKEIQPNWEYIEDSVDFVEGPLVGILSVHQKYPNNDLFILACDMINMEESIIRNLVSAYAFNSEKNFYFYLNGIYLETLCGIYTSKGLREISKKVNSSSNKNFAIHKLISDYNSLIIQVSEGNKKSFANFNTSMEIDNIV